MFEVTDYLCKCTKIFNERLSCTNTASILPNEFSLNYNVLITNKRSTNIQCVKPRWLYINNQLLSFQQCFCWFLNQFITFWYKFNFQLRCYCSWRFMFKKPRGPLGCKSFWTFRFTMNIWFKNFLQHQSKFVQVGKIIFFLT